MQGGTSANHGRCCLGGVLFSGRARCGCIAVAPAARAPNKAKVGELDASRKRLIVGECRFQRVNFGRRRPKESLARCGVSPNRCRLRHSRLRKLGFAPVREHPC